MGSGPLILLSLLLLPPSKGVRRALGFYASLFSLGVETLCRRGWRRVFALPSTGCSEALGFELGEPPSAALDHPGNHIALGPGMTGRLLIGKHAVAEENGLDTRARPGSRTAAFSTVEMTARLAGHGPASTVVAVAGVRATTAVLHGEVMPATVLSDPAGFMLGIAVPDYAVASA